MTNAPEPPMILYMTQLSKPNTVLALDYNGSFHVVQVNVNNHTYSTIKLEYKKLT